MLPSQRKLSQVQADEINLANDSGLQQRSTFNLMSTEAGGRANLGFTRVDQKNYLRTKRQRAMKYGEVGCLISYFQKQLLANPSFYHTYQMDSEEQITNIFWADARMILDYGYFGDVMSFDTTYCTNNSHRPLALFSGFNHFKETVIFGASLLYDETTSSFKWLFETFLEAHGGKKPVSIFTDQDQAMAKALSEVMPETYHGLCTWHLKQNCIKHLGNLMKDESRFLSDFKTCMYDLVEETQFEEAWSSLLSRYNVHENSWLTSVYKIKKKWAACYMKQVLTLGLRSTQVSESLNADVKRCLTTNVDILELLKHLERNVEEKRYNELTREFEARDTIAKLSCPDSPMLKQLANVYTPKMLKKFQKQFSLFLACYIKRRNESPPLIEYIICVVERDEEFRVLFDPLLKSISCSCKRFENVGILCCHALKVFETNDVKCLPDNYILKRWTREAKSGVIHDSKGIIVEEDSQMIFTQRYRELCPMMVKLASQVVSSEKRFTLVKKVVEELSRRVMDLHLEEENAQGMDSNGPSTTSMLLPMGIKKREGLKRKGCLKGWVDVMDDKKKKPASVTRPKSKPSHDIEGLSQFQYKVVTPPQSQPSLDNEGLNQIQSQCSQQQNSNYSLTKFLMENFDVSPESLRGLEFFCE